MIIGHPLKTKSLDLPEILTLDGSDIKQVSQAKSLGIIIDENLTWDEHFRRVKGRMSAGLSALKRLKNILPQSQLCSVYYALVESHLRYGDVIWGSLCTTKLAALQRLQSRAWSIIENAKLKDLWSSSWLNVEKIGTLFSFSFSLYILNSTTYNSKILTIHTKELDYRDIKNVTEKSIHWIEN